ncbi:hypothetical protein SAMN04488125_10215 [Methylorubrum salsuginis]|uniref:Uncharacterized protein n=2 Tax=Methylorubrum salsuginis TaxID=414703 RepID=A0A1I3ZPL2_9HYPH|nr:hypothetical protein SAMN04488125_10215 [Methylorubrum salsuginis]
MLLSSATTALGCGGFPFPERGSVVTWPDRFLVAKVKVLRVRRIAAFERYARLRPLRPLRPIRGELPRAFGVLYETSSCGAHVTQGEAGVRGFTALKPERWTKDYRFATGSSVGT